MKDSFLENKSIVREISVALVTGIVISIVNFFIWQKQDKAGKDQKLFDYKLAAIEKFALSSSKFEYNNQYSIRIRFEDYKMQATLVDSINKIRKTVKIGKVPDSYAYRIQKVLEKRFPYEYSMHMKNLDYYGEATTNMLLPQFMFSNQTCQKLQSFEHTFSQDYVISVIDDMARTKNIDFKNLDCTEVTLKITRKQREIENEILQNMYNEIEENIN